LGCQGKPKTLVYDLARRTTVADRWSARAVVLFGTPSAEPSQAEGFHREAGGAEGDTFVWSKGEAEVSLTWPGVEARAAVVDLAPYGGAKDQSAEVFLNGASVARFALSDLRHRYRFPLPAEKQRPGENRLRFVFAKTASPADADPNNADKRRLAAAFYSLTVAAAGDGALDDLLGRDAPVPFAIGDDKGAPVLTLVGPAVVRYAIHVPSGPELRATPDLHPAARAAGAQASFRVTIEERPGEEREIWSRVIRARDKGPGEIRLALPVEPGSVVRLALHVTGDRFAWGTWSAPRLLGRGGFDPLVPKALRSGDNQRADGLRKSLSGANVLFVILDAARARDFGCYGYARATTPEIDRIAKEGVVFESAFTPAVYTLGAMSSVWTSQHPDRHHSEVSFSARLPRSRLTLPELLGAQGIRTAGFVANAVAGTAFGFERGFDEFRETHGDPEFGSRAAGLGKAVLPWIGAHKSERFFLYVHFREPHYPYDPTPPFDTRFGPDGPLPKSARSDNFAFFTEVNKGRRKLTPAEAENLVRLYDGNLAVADQELGEIRKALEAAGLWEKTVVIVAADHGEELREHGWIGHNVHVYDESAHVPLVVRLPAAAGVSGKRVEGLTDLLDVAPTVADVLGVPPKATDRHFEGRSLLPMIAGASGKGVVLSRTIWDRPIYALRDEAFKFVFDTRTGEQALYDVAEDPGETRNLEVSEPIRAAYYREALHHWTLGLGRRTAAAGADEAAPWTCEQCENMKSLGYLGADIKCPCK
jgi:arylsulfatase A-like enzyme